MNFNDELMVRGLVIPYKDENVGFFHYCLEVEDINAIWNKIIETGAPMDDAPKCGGDGNWQCRTAFYCLSLVTFCKGID